MGIEEALGRRSVAIIAAHPDDETVSASLLLMRRRDVSIIHVTDGAPRKPYDAVRAGCESREEYAALRGRELAGALAIAGWGGISEGSVRGKSKADQEVRPTCLNVADQEASLDMPGLARRLIEAFRETRPGAVLTHPYEGGHPDHDATAFAVHAACGLTTLPPEIYEFTSYHAGPLDKDARAGPPKIETGRFLPGLDPGEVFPLSAEARECKAKMIACFASQTSMLRHFAVDEERFRAAPAYDFSLSPHPGKLLYEYFDWGMTGERWRSLAAEAAAALGVPTIL